MPLVRAPEDEIFDTKRKFEVNMVRRKKGKIISRAKVHTRALSREQAEHYAKFRKPGYSITQVRMEI